MKVVMTLLVRDEADIIEDQLRYHLERGVDFVIATDHRSSDGTTEILARYERDRVLYLIREEAEGLRQSEWVTRMARLAATDFAADWVINADADEFWWARECSIHDVLAAVPKRFGAIRGLWRHFVLRPDGAEPFYERMQYRRLPDPAWTSPYHVQAKIVHRADPDVVVTKGNHDALGRELVLLREWYPFEVLHFPIRSREQLRRKYVTAADAGRLGESRLPRHIEATANQIAEDGGSDVYDGLLVDDAALAVGLAQGTLVADTRVRDSLQRGAYEPAAHLLPSLAEDVALAAEIDQLHEHDAATRLRVRADGVERRLAVLETTRLLFAGQRR